MFFPEFPSTIPRNIHPSRHPACPLSLQCQKIRFSSSTTKSSAFKFPLPFKFSHSILPWGNYLTQLSILPYPNIQSSSLFSSLAHKHVQLASKLHLPLTTLLLLPSLVSQTSQKYSILAISISIHSVTLHSQSSMSFYPNVLGKF
jgi:hypothetical protein